MLRKDNLSKQWKNNIQDLIVKLPKLKVSLYKTLSLLYSPPDFYLKEIKAKTFLFFLSNFLTTLQLASILFKPEIKLSGWSNFSVIWKTIQYSRYDVVCQIVLETQVCSNTFLYFTVLAGVLFVVVLVFQYFYKKTIRLFFLYLKIFIVVTQLQGISFIYSSIRIFSNSNLNGEIDVSMRILSFLAFIILMAFEYFLLTFGYEFRHFFSHYNINSRASNIVMWKSKFVLLTTIIVLDLGSDAYFEVAEVTCFIINTIIVYLIAKNYPFYQLRANYLVIIPHLMMSSGSMSLIIAKIINNVFICVLGVSLLTPILFLLIIDRMAFHLNNLKSCGIRDIQDVHQFELNFRNLLKKKLILDNEENFDPQEYLCHIEMIKHFNYIFYKSKCQIRKIFLLWFTSFCFYNCQLHKVALIKSSLFLKVFPSLEEDFHEYHLKKKMYSIVENEYQKYKVLIKYRKLENLKKIEKSVILEFLDFQNSLLGSDTSINLLEKKMRNFKRYFKTTLKKYTILLTRFPNSLMVLNSFLTLLELFKTDLNKSTELNSKVEALKNTIKFVNSRQDNNTDNSPILLVSALKHDIGRVIFVNQAFSDLIKQPAENILNTYVQSLFPDSINLFSLDVMKKFKEKVVENAKYLNCITYLKLSDWELVEVNLEIVLMSYSKGFFLFSFTQLHLERDVVLINMYGVILGLTPRINKLLGNEENKVGKFISEFLPVSVNTLIEQQGHEICLQNPPLLIQYTQLNVNNCCVRVIYFYKNHLNQVQAKSELSEVFSSIKFRKSFLVFQKDSVPNPFFVQKFGQVSEKESKSEESDSLNIEKSKSQRNKKMKIELILQKSSIKIIKLFHLVVVLSILSICASTIFSMIFLKLQINSITSRKTLNSLATSLNSMKVIADYSYILSLNINFQEKINPIKLEYQNAVNQLEFSMNNFSDFDHNWNFCPNTEKLFKSSIPVYYSQEHLLNIKLYTAFRFFAQMVDAGKNFYTKNENQTDYIQEFRFIQANSFGPAYQYFLAIQKELISCENQSFKNLGVVKIFLLFGGLVVITVCGIVCACLIKNVQAKQLNLWKKMMKKVFLSKIIRNRCLARLSTINLEGKSINQIKSYNKSKLPKLKFYVRYVIAVSVFLFLGTAYYLTAYYLFYSKFESSLQTRLGLLSSLINSKSSLTSFNYWEINKYLQPNDIAFKTGGYSFCSEDYSKSIKNEIIVLKNSLNYIKNNIEEVLESGTFFDKIFKSQDSLYYLKKGTVAGIFAWIFDGYYALSKQMAREEEINHLIYLVYIRKELDLLYKYYLNNSDNRLDILLSYYINITCCFLIAYFLFYFFWFRLFLRKERKAKRDFEYILNILEKAEIGRKDNINEFT